ncbi:MAG: Rid family hydrolase [Cyanobacteria bacterium J06633_23]
MKNMLSQFLAAASQQVRRWRWALLMTGIVSLIIVVASTRVMAASPPREVTFFGNPASSISSGVAVPRYSSYFFTSGLVPARREDGTYAPSTFDQAVSVLTRIEDLLAEEGLTLNDVIYINAYLTADPETGEVDYRGWFDAYAQFFNNDENPTKVARATLGVESLVLSDWRIEISAIAVYPR